MANIESTVEGIFYTLISFEYTNIFLIFFRIPFFLIYFFPHLSILLHILFLSLIHKGRNPIFVNIETPKTYIIYQICVRIYKLLVPACGIAIDITVAYQFSRARET